MLAAFFTTNAEAMGSSIPNISIIRIHLPPPANARPDKAGIKPVNKGFAYVDFASEDVLKAALALSETPFAGRKVLIKEAKNFAGRPEKDVTQGATATPKADEARAGSSANQGKVTRRVFVGNLGFDVTKEDLEKHYATCGTVVDIHMATFEDTGKCKGFAWVTFEDTSAAEAAVRGWARVNEDEVEPDVEVEEQDSDKDQEEKPKKEKKPKTRKWFVNRLLGRQLRCEFAEDASTRYKKRFGKDAVNPKHSYGDENNEGSARATGTGAGESKMSGRDKRRAEKAASLGKHSTFAYGGDDESRYRTGGIAPAEGQKITFD
ncbi:hypothetical protein FH972_022454 [Carpinus fangiana]|uniref:RRM domain-containing protein n=1 Tax=Carpinus fangiana TaxID=176857 RepID=A0A5N6KSZ1_9ROSI|nr:hypothetical protein FH972_022454 [Carpinus fangiana]